MKGVKSVYALRMVAHWTGASLAVRFKYVSRCLLHC